MTSQKDKDIAVSGGVAQGNIPGSGLGGGSGEWPGGVARGRVPEEVARGRVPGEVARGECNLPFSSQKYSLLYLAPYQRY